MSNETIVVVGLECSRCYGESTMKLDPDEGLDKSTVWACPHCFNGETANYKIEERYEIIDVKAVDHDEYDAMTEITVMDESHSALSELSLTDWIAVRVNQEQYTERAKQRGVSPQAVHQNVQRATEKLS